MTAREKFVVALEGGQVVGRVPHFELVFFLTMEAFGRVHPSHRVFSQWEQMSARERELQRRDIADVYVMTARRYEHSAILFHAPGQWGNDPVGEMIGTLEEIRGLSGGEFFLMVHGDATYSIENAARMMEFAERIADHPEQVRDKAARMVDEALVRGERIRSAGVLDGMALCSDYCFNTGPFMSPAMFDDFITPYLARLTAGYRAMGFYVIKHTDGNIMPILDSLLSTRPHALHSLDPQGGIDMAEMKRRAGKKVCLIGNVNCAVAGHGDG